MELKEREISQESVLLIIIENLCDDVNKITLATTVNTQTEYLRGKKLSFQILRELSA